MIATLTVSPRRQKVGLYFSLLPNENVDTGNLLPFVSELCCQLGTPIILVRDRLNVHRSAAVRRRRSGPTTYSEFLPPYAPVLNPVERFWSYLKLDPLANEAAFDIRGLHRRAKRHLRRIAADPVLLHSFLRGTPLS